MCCNLGWPEYEMGLKFAMLPLMLASNWDLISYGRTLWHDNAYINLSIKLRHV